MHYLADKAPVTRHYSAKQILKQIASRYMRANPYSGFCVKPSVVSGFQQGVDGLHRIDFSKKYPDAKLGDYAYAYTCIRSDVAASDCSGRYDVRRRNLDQWGMCV